MKWDHVQSVKEVARHVLYRIGLGSALSISRRRLGYETAHLGVADTAERFAAVYRLGAWVHSSGQVSGSGTGSEAASTNHLITALPALVQRFGCRKLLDVGCGDWNWMQRV